MRMNVKAPARKPKPAALSKKCNCKNSKCLKLYCECFASGRYCDNCNCLNCFNNHENEAVRQQAVEGILERNPNAFRPKIQTAEGEATRSSDGVRHCKGCNCKKSGCLKKYCECFQGGIFCSEICRCLDCKNYEGSEARAHVMKALGAHGPQAPPGGPAASGSSGGGGGGGGSIPGMKRQRLLAPAAPVGAATPLAAAGLPPPGMLPLLLPVCGAGSGPLSGLLLPQAGAAGGVSAGLPPLPGLPGIPGLPGLLLPQVVRAASAGPSPGLAPVTEQLTPRPAAYAAVHGALRDEVVEELSRLLLLVAREEGDRAGTSTADATAAAADDGAGSAGPSAGAGSGDGGSAAAGGSAAGGQRQQEQSELLAALAAAQAAVHAAEAAAASEQQQLAGGAACGSSGDGPSARYAAQEAAVLAEFEGALRSVLAAAVKKLQQQPQDQNQQQQGAADGLAACNGADGLAAAAAAAGGDASDAGRVPPLSLPSPLAGTPGSLSGLPGCGTSPASEVSMQQAVALQAAAAAAGASALPQAVLGSMP